MDAWIPAICIIADDAHDSNLLVIISVTPYHENKTKREELFFPDPVIITNQ